MHMRTLSNTWRASMLALQAFALTAFASVASAATTDAGFEQTNTTFTSTPAATGAGGDMVNSVGNTVTGISGIITGPVLYIIMGVAIMISVFGFVSGKMTMAFSGIGAFILAAVLKAMFGLLF